MTTSQATTVALTGAGIGAFIAGDMAVVATG
jgi:hypothetical protein